MNGHFLYMLFIENLCAILAKYIKIYCKDLRVRTKLVLLFTHDISVAACAKQSNCTNCTVYLVDSKQKRYFFTLK